MKPRKSDTFMSTKRYKNDTNLRKKDTKKYTNRAVNSDSGIIKYAVPPGDLDENVEKNGENLWQLMNELTDVKKKTDSNQGK